MNTREMFETKICKLLFDGINRYPNIHSDDQVYLMNLWLFNKIELIKLLLEMLIFIFIIFMRNPYHVLKMLRRGDVNV